MVITLTTGCVLGVCSALGLFGAGKSVAAAMDNSEANKKNETAQSIIDNAKNAAKNARKTVKLWFTKLGNKRIFVRQHPIARFIDTFSKIRNFDAKKLPFAKEPMIQKFDIAEIKAEGIKFTSTLASVTGSATAGGALALGAYGAVGSFATVIGSTTAISSLSGAAATNATLAWLGGGSLAAGGGGMAAGAVVLGGLVAGPALAIFGSVVGAQASAKLNQAKSNLAKAKKVDAQVSAAVTVLNGLTKQAKLYLKLTNDMCEMFIPQLGELVEIVEKYGTDYKKYSKKCQNQVVATVSSYQVLRALVDAGIMQEDGTLDPKSNKVIEIAQKFLNAA